MKKRPPLRLVLWALIAAAAWGAPRLGALEIKEGLIRLVIHENSGRFSLFYLTDAETERYEPLFTHQDPRTSFLAVNVDSRIYRLGEAAVFGIYVEKNQNAPAIIFESPFLRVRQEFSFVRTPGSAVSNGVRMVIRVINTGDKASDVGVRLLLDTNLGEGYGYVPFVTNVQDISSETVINGETRDQWWVSRNNRLGFMGSIYVGAAKKPDSLHFANWKRLNDMPWKTGYFPGRTFNYPPYSIGDSAVCYYYEPVSIAPEKTLSYLICLAVEDPAGFGIRDGTAQSAGANERNARRETDLQLLRNILDRLDRFIRGEISLTAEELADIERTVSRLKSRYNLP